MIKTFSHHTKHCFSTAGCPVHRIQWSRQGKTEQVSHLQGKWEDTKWLWDQGMPACARDPVGSNMATNRCCSSPWHPQPQYQMQCNLGFTLALGRRACTEHQWTSAQFGLCVSVRGEWDSKTQLAQALSMDAFSSSVPRFNRWHLPRQQLSPIFPSSELGNVCMRNQEQQFSLTEKVWKTKNFVSGREGCPVPLRSCFLEHTSAFSFLSTSQPGITLFQALSILLTPSFFLTLDFPGNVREAAHIPSAPLS